MGLTALNNQSIASLTDFISTDDMPAGSVINVVSYEYSGSQVSIASNASATLWQTPTYTPQSSTSKIVYVTSLIICGDCDVDGHSVYGQTSYYTGVNGTETVRYQSDPAALVDRGGHSRTRASNYAVEVTGHGGQGVHFRAHFSSSSSSNRNALCMNPGYGPSTVVLYEIEQ